MNGLLYYNAGTNIHSSTVRQLCLYTKIVLASYSRICTTQYPYLTCEYKNIHHFSMLLTKLTNNALTEKVIVRSTLTNY